MRETLTKQAHIRLSVGAPAAGAIIAAAVSFAAPAHAATAPQADDPFRAHVALGAAREDNLFRLEGSEEALEEIGTSELDDWYRYLTAGFERDMVGDEQRFQIQGELYRQTYDTFDDLDHTGGTFLATGEWSLSDATTGNLGYRFNRRLQSFTNKASTVKDMVKQHDIDGGIEHTLAQRWQMRFAGGWSDLNFSNSQFLDKEQLDGEAELQYAASQNSIFGLLATYTESDFDVNDNRDWTGWSLGPSFRWQMSTSFRLTANVGYTHRGLDESQGGLDDYDDVTGFVAGRWQPGERFSTTVRLFRDVSSLGGEISDYTERTGIRIRPEWQITPKLSSELNLEYEERDFSVVETDAVDRKDDYYLVDLSLTLAMTRQLLFSVGYGYEHRTSNVEDEEFDAEVIRAEIRWNL